MCLGITINCVLGDDNLFERQHPSLTSSCAWNSGAVPSCWLPFLWALPSWSSCELPSVSLKTWKKADCVRVRVILDHCSCPQPAERAILKYSPHLSVGILFKDSIGDSGLTSPSLYSRIIDPNSGRDSLLSVLCRLSPTPHQHQRNQIYPKYIQNYNQIYLQLKLNLASA